MHFILSLLLGSAFYRSVSSQCQPAMSNQTVLNDVRTANSSSLSGYPFGLVYAAEPGLAFVSLNSESENKSSTLGVLNATGFPPVLLHEIVLNNTQLNSVSALGVALSSDGKYVFVASGTGAYIVDAAKAIEGASDSVIGILDGVANVTGNAAIEVTLTRDGSYAFVSQEYGPMTNANPHYIGNVDVFKLNGTQSSEHIGYISLGDAVVGTALSPDEMFLYVTSEVADTNYTSAGLKPAASGLLSVLNVTLLKTEPEKSQIANVTAGCQPVREIVSSDGSYVWVSARASNLLLGFNASALVNDPANALIASVVVGTAPVGLTFAKNETRIITADSNRFNTPGGHTGLTVVDVEAALNGSEAVLGYIATGLFPREFATSQDGNTLLVSDFSSQLVQAVDLGTLP